MTIWIRPTSVMLVLICIIIISIIGVYLYPDTLISSICKVTTILSIATGYGYVVYITLYPPSYIFYREDHKAIMKKSER
jgi:membrane protein YdbS with pleckstrin-like domain